MDSRFSIIWHDYLASSLGYIVVQVDGRGCFGPGGRKLRNPVKNKLGTYEVIDQINAAKEWASRHYVDKTRIGVWGWASLILSSFDVIMFTANRAMEVI